MRRLAVAAATVALLGFCLVVGANVLLGVANRWCLRELGRLGAAHGVRIEPISDGNARFAWPAAVVWRGLSIEARGAGRDLHLPDQGFTGTVERAEAVLESLGERRFAILLAGLRFTAIGDAAADDGTGVPQVSRVEGSALRFSATIDFFNPRRAAGQLRDLAGQFAELARSGSCALPLRFDGAVTFPFRGRPEVVAIRVQPQGAGSTLVVAEDDLLALASRLELKVPLTADEVRLLARYPLRVPRLLAIRDKASRLAEEALRRDRDFPKDAGRHLLWSYLLTRAYDERFATLVTDAHEQGITGNLEEEQRMDRSNNALGRSYAQSGLSEAEVLARATTDPRVVRSFAKADRTPRSSKPGTAPR